MLIVLALTALITEQQNESYQRRTRAADPAAIAPSLSMQAPPCDPAPSSRANTAARAPAPKGRERAWEPLPALEPAEGSGPDAVFARSRAELRRCINDKPVSLAGFTCVDEPPPRVVGGLLHMVEKMDPETMAKTLARTSPNAEHPTVFIDVGVNDGKAVREMMTVPHLQIYGFEPNPGQLDGLLREVESGGLGERVHLFPAGVGKEAGQLTLNYGKNDNAGSSFAYGHKTDVDAHRYEQKQVNVVTLDEVVLPHIDPESMIVLKIDTQGWEMDVLRGAAELLRTRGVRYIVAELGPYILCERGVNPIEILETLNCMGPHPHPPSKPTSHHRQAGFHCSDSKWMPTMSPNKFAKKCNGVNKAIGSGCGMTSDTEQQFNRCADPALFVDSPSSRSGA